MGVFDGCTTTVSAAWAFVMGQLGSGAVVASRATGYTATSATSIKAIRATAYTPQGSNVQRSIVSSSANDAGAGTGAQQVAITYLDASFAVHYEIITLNGTTPVNTVGSNYAYIESMIVTRVGSAGANVGVVSLFTGLAGAGSAWASMNAGDNQTFWASHYVPSGVSCYIVSMQCAAYTTIGTANLRHRGNPSLSNLPLAQIGPTILHAGGNQSDHLFTVPLVITGPDLIEMYTQPSVVTPDTSIGNFEYLQF